MECSGSHRRTPGLTISKKTRAGRARCGGRGGLAGHGHPLLDPAEKVLAFQLRNAASRAAESASRNNVAQGWRRRMEAGHASWIGPSTAARTARRFAAPGTTTTMRGVRMRTGIVSDKARSWDILQPRERAVVHLLQAAGLVQIHKANAARVGEVANRRVDKRQVPVFADARHGARPGFSRPAGPRSGRTPRMGRPHRREARERRGPVRGRSAGP